MGIEPTQSAWKAEVLPLNYTRIYWWWRGKDSNLRKRSCQIYSLVPLTTREPLQQSFKFGFYKPKNKHDIVRMIDPRVNKKS